MMTLFTMVLGWFGNSVIRWVAVVGIGLVISGVGAGWLRSDARAPYEKQITELKDIIKKRDAAAAADKALVDAQTAQAAELQNELDKMVETAAHTPDACKLTPGELSSLRKLSGAHRNRTPVRAPAS
jgi:type VI protein secretion system component VasK